MAKIGIIGGSGLYRIDGLTDTKWVKVDTPFGAPSDEYLKGKLSGEDIVRRVLNAAGEAVEDYVIARDVQSLEFARASSSSNWITISASNSEETVKEYPVVYNIITSVHSENENF